MKKIILGTLIAAASMMAANYVAITMDLKTGEQMINSIGGGSGYSTVAADKINLVAVHEKVLIRPHKKLIHGIFEDKSGIDIVESNTVVCGVISKNFEVGWQGIEC